MLEHQVSPAYLYSALGGVYLLEVRKHGGFMQAILGHSAPAHTDSEVQYALPQPVF